MVSGLRALILQDREEDARLIVRELRRAGFEPVADTAKTEAEFLARLDPVPDVVLADFMLRGFGALQALRLLRERALDVPLIVISGSMDDETAVAGLRQGAADYLLRDRLGRLGSAVTRVMEERRLTALLRQRDEQLRQTQKMEAIGQLAGGLAHDFNNLLTVITSTAELVLAELPLGDSLRDDIEQMRGAAERAAGLTRQLLAFGRKQVLQPQPLDLNETMGGLERMLRRVVGARVEVEVRREPELGLVRADPGQIEQVMVNLAVNARDAMGGGGGLTIETANVWLDEEDAGRPVELSPGQFVMLAVSNTGSGMDAATRARVFEPFFTTKGTGRGTGLGLATVYGIVTQSGGAIGVESEPGRGSVFRVYLPRIASPGPAAAPPERQRGGAGAGETVLLVKDDDGVRSLASRVLRRQGYRVLAADGPAEAERLGETVEGPLHLLLTDVVMPEGGGPALAAHLTTRRPGLKVLFMSGYGDGTSGVPAGARLLAKPFSAEELGRRVRETLDQP